MKITIEKRPNVETSRDTIDIEQDLGIDIEDWEQMTQEEKNKEIDGFVNNDDALANACFHYHFEILED